MVLPAGTCFGRYEILGPIGAGGMGEVYRARDTRLLRDVAIKVIRPGTAAHSNARARFLREARAVAALSHPNILDIHDVGSEGETVWAVTELLEGETLHGRLARGRLSTRPALQIAHAIAEGLAAAHTHGIVHRDLKPDNVFLTSDGLVKILDFGLARMVEELPASESGVQTATEPGLVVGTPGYMSPEQVRGEEPGPPSDVFSFGCVLYEMLTGERAFRGASPAETLAMVLSTEPRDPGELAPIPPDVAAIVMRCLEKSSGARFHDGRELVFALGLVEHEVATAPPPRDSVTARISPPLPLRRGLPLLAVAAAVAASAVLWLWSRGRSAPPNDSLAVLPFVNAGGQEDSQYLADGITESLINRLSRVPRLRVLARTTSFLYRGERDPRKAGRALQVRTVLTGQVLRRGDGLAVQADLLDVERGTQLWGAHFDAKAGDTLELPEQLARRIVDALDVPLSADDTARLAQRSTASAEAHDLYLRGRYHWNKRSEEGIAKGIALFEEAIAKDARFAPAYAGLADSYNLLAYYGLRPPQETVPKAREAAVKALEIDDTLAEAHAALGDIRYQFEGDWQEAERRFRRALALSPGYATAHQWYSNFLSASSRFPESLEEIERARSLDPLNLMIDNDVGLAYYWAGAYDRAEARLRATLELEPRFPLGHFYAGLVQLRRSGAESALGELETAKRLSEDEPDPIALWGYACARAGRRADAEEALSTLQGLAKKRWVSSFPFILVELGLGHRDRALDHLEAALEEHAGRLVYLNVEHAFDPLRQEPRFQEVVRRLRIP